MLVAAAIAEVVGALGTAFLREMLDISGTGDTALLERALFLVLALPAGAFLAKMAVGHWWSTPEIVATLVAVAMSFWIGPGLLEAAGRLLDMGSIRVDLSASELSADPFWWLAIVVVLLPGRYYIWNAYGVVRGRAAYGRLRKIVVDRTSADRAVVESATGALEDLYRVETPRTQALVDSVSNWFRAWLASPDGLEASIAEPLTVATARQMEALYGSPTSSQ